MAEGNYLPNSNKNKLFRFLYNSDDLGLKTADDWVAFFAGGGIEASYYPVDTDAPTAEIAWILKKKIPESKPMLPATAPKKQLENLNKDIK